MRSHNKSATKSESDDSKPHQYDTRKRKKKREKKATILYFEPIRNNNGYNMTRNDT